MDMMDILRSFIKAERTGNWDLHLHNVREMLPYFLAAGHTLYDKSAYVYLNNTMELESQHPHVHMSFKLGKHVIRRSDCYWAGLSSDLVIEQVLMRSVKTTGGLTLVGERCDELPLVLKHELCSYPPALFEDDVTCQ